MRITPLTVPLTTPVRDLMALGDPWVRARDASEYWAYATFFADTCPVALAGDGTVAGAVIAFQSQTRPDEMYVQDVMVEPKFRRQGVARALIAATCEVATRRGVTKLYLTSDPDNFAAQATWLRLGFTNRLGDYESGAGVQVIADFKGRGKDRAVFDRILA